MHKEHSRLRRRGAVSDDYVPQRQCPGSSIVVRMVFPVPYRAPLIRKVSCSSRVYSAVLGGDSMLTPERCVDDESAAHPRRNTGASAWHRQPNGQLAATRLAGPSTRRHPGRALGVAIALRSGTHPPRLVVFRRPPTVTRDTVRPPSIPGMRAAHGRTRPYCNSDDSRQTHTPTNSSAHTHRAISCTHPCLLAVQGNSTNSIGL